MDDRRRFVAIIVLFVIGFALVALASALDATWPLFLTPLPYAVIPWLVVHADDERAPSAPAPEGDGEAGTARPAVT